jgi:predicted transcriptional regulator
MKTSPKRQTYSIRLQPRIMNQLRHLAVDRPESLSELLEQAVEDFLLKHGRGFPEQEADSD